MALTAAAAQARIDEIDALLAGGVRSVQSASGRRIEYDQQALQAERDRILMAIDRATRGITRRGVYRAG